MYVLFLLLCGTLAGAAPVARFDFDTAPADGWKHKDNTALSSAEPQAGAAALRVSIDPTNFSYGWIHRELPEADYGNLRGIHGFYRAAKGVSGQLGLHLCLASPGADLSYFRGEVGALAHSQGEWVEFYLPLGVLRWERGPIRQLRPEALGTDDLLQFIAGVEARQPVSFDLDTVSLVGPDEAPALARRLLTEQRLRQLRPEAEGSGNPHPRLLLTPDRLAGYRARATAGDDRQAVYERFLQHAETHLRSYNAADPLVSMNRFLTDTSLESRAWSASFEGEVVRACAPLEVLAAAFRLTGEERFGAAAASALVKLAAGLGVDEPAWAKGFYYTRTFQVRALAFGYDWLWERLTPVERRAVKAALVGFISDIHQQSMSASWGRRPLQRVWNWDPGLMAACGLAVLAIEGETRLGEQAILFDCRRHVADYLTLGIDPDGCGHEGPNYLGYGFGAGAEFAEVLRRQGRGDLFTETNYHLIAPWLIAETLPDGRRWNNLSDGGYGQRPWPAYLYAAARYGELARGDAAKPGERWPSPTLTRPLGFLQQFAEAPGPRPLSYHALAKLYAWEWRQAMGALKPQDYDDRAALAHVLLYEPLPEPADPTTLLPLGTLFRGRGLAVSRTGFGPEDFHLAVEAGPHAAGHDQGDKGTFTLRAYGADLAVDSGYGNDGEPLKSGSSQAHNVVLIDGQGQPIRFHNQSGGAVTGYHHSPLLDWIRVDAREAWNVRYDPELVPQPTGAVARAERTLLFVRPRGNVPGYVVVYDDLAADSAEHDYTWQWHIPADRRFELADGRWSSVRREVTSAVLTTAADRAAGSASFEFEVPTAGRYVVYGLVRAGGLDPGKSDSFFVSLDDEPRLTWDLLSGAALAWDGVTERGEPGPRVFDLSSGRHRLKLEAREPQAEFAGWAILPAGSPAPQAPDE
ncbi:MAG: heparinase II/III family protein, partial [Armatimonadetes bacterium]|nr:heparinase II/III family protein [Armatimonadota bacterium]